MAAGTSVAAAAIVAGIIGVIVLPAFLFVREVAVFSPTRILGPQEAGLVAEWFLKAARLLGIGSLSIFYTYRKGAGLQVVQLSGSPVSSRHGEESGSVQGALAVLIHRAAWHAMPAVTRLEKNVFVAIPARIMETLYSLAGKGARGAYLSLHTRGHVKLVYKTLYELASAGQPRTGNNRVYTSYLATKTFTRMLVEGDIRISPELAEKIDSLVPVEPPWIRRRVLKQIEEESRAFIEP